MPRFRRRIAADSTPVGDVRVLLDDVFQPRHFYIGPGLSVIWQHAITETIPWETYQGRLLDGRQTRQQRSFVSWHLLESTADGPAAAPLMALKWDAERGEIHVVRGLLCHAWEPTDVGGNVIESRATTKWILELVGTLALADFTDEDELRDELICRLWQAVVGTSRLPLTSLEAPLPGFVLGQLAYVYRPTPPTPLPQGASGEPMRDWRELIDHGWSANLAWREQAKLLEVVLRAATPGEIAEATIRFNRPSIDLKRLLRATFNDVSLSPWTGFVANALAFVQSLVKYGPWAIADEVEFLGWILRKLSRHLTAYDLVTFHHRGANYPDALLLDAVLKRYLQVAEEKPELFAGDSDEGIMRRRALRQGALVRRSYEGYAVPDAPTSPGENARVLPAPFAQVAEEQVSNPLRRTKQLFDDDPLETWWTATTRRIFRQSVEDTIFRLKEMNELGMATFIDRPLGLGKAPLEPDQTPLVAHEAHSYGIEKRRQKELTTLIQEVGPALPAEWEAHCYNQLENSWAENALCGPVAIEDCAALARPVATLTDAVRSNESYSVLRTVPGSARLIADLFEWDMLNRRFGLKTLWQCRYFKCMRLKMGMLKYGVMALCSSVKSLDNPVDFQWICRNQIRVVFETDPAQGFRSRGGVELPVAGLRIWQVVEDDGTIHDLRGEVVHVLPRW